MRERAQTELQDQVDGRHRGGFRALGNLLITTTGACMLGGLDVNLQ